MLRLVDRIRPNRTRRSEANRLIDEADAANRSQDWARAAEFYGRALAVDPSRAAIYIQLGHALKEQGFLGRAVEAYRASIARAGRIADSHLQLGHALKLQGRLPEAAEAYAKAHRLDPACADIEREYLATAAHHLPAAQALPRVAEPPARPAVAASRAAVAAILEQADLGHYLAERFDAQFYVFRHPELAAAGRGADVATALRHFCEHGLARLDPIAPGCDLDPAFYARTYLGNRPMAPQAAYRHWLTLGLGRGWAPNAARLTHDLFGAATPDEVPRALLDSAVREPDGDAWVARFDQAMMRVGQDVPALRRLFERLVERLVQRGGPGRDTAFALVQRLMDEAPSARIRQLYADGLRERHCYREAEPLYAAAIAAGTLTNWVLYHRSLCLDILGRWPEALAVAARGRRLLPGDPGLRTSVDTLATRVVGRAWDVALDTPVDRLGEGQAQLAATLDEVSRLIRADGQLARRPIRRIAIVGNQDLEQCRFYRIEQKIEQFARAGFAVALFDQHTGLDDFMEEAGFFDAAIFYRVAAFHPMMRAIDRARELGLATFYEVDDLIFEAEHYPTSLESYGGQIDAREYVGLAMGVPLFAAAMRLCEFGIASTPALATAMGRHVSSGRVFVHRNAFGAVHERFAARPVTRAARDKVTFFYGSGTKAHKEDFQRLVEPALKSLVDRYGAQVSIVLVGYVTLGETLQSIRGNLVLLDMMKIEAFWDLLPSVDVNLAVLLPSAMADAKSEIKWMEAAMLGVPSVCSDTATHRAVIDEGETGFLCATPEQWTATLDRLFNDPALRHRVGDRARAAVLERYSLDAAARNLAALLRDVSPAEPPRRRRKVLVVNVFYPPVDTGGATRVVHDNVRQITARHGEEIAIEVFTTANVGTPYRLSAYALEGVRVTSLSTPDRPDIDAVVADPAMGLAFERFLLETQPDLIHFHCIQRLTVSVVEAARRVGIPYAITAHDGWWISGEQFLVDEALRVERYAFDDPAATLRDFGPAEHARMEAVRPALFGATRVLGVSEPFSALYRSCGVPNVVALPNGVSDDILPVPKTTRPDKVRLGFVGGLERHKGSLLIRVALEGGRFDNLDLLVVDHALRPGESRREAWGDVPVTVIAKRPQKQVAELYADIDVLLAPSIWPESYGLVTREALQSGCWVVASDRGSIGEDVVDGENGFVVDVSTVLPLREALARIDREPARYKQPPAPRALRTSTDQAEDLVAFYRSFPLRAPQARSAALPAGPGADARPAQTGRGEA